ncbi:ketohexokinase-like [Pseudomyrmex gracilis]|uniref:ketohexokinase-like n=1 Tax=Pseudomyrmex gracilis TaxID=219809 RepID=UPI0009951B76|nr:ketohexokinase-like [Pseudomyrmex gracilis]XP_020289501.1 ketohexokinase-like [Pseudomyrmex gracilis]
MASSSYEEVGSAFPIKNDTLKILCVGRVCLDIVYTCQQFPSEDSTVRAVDYRWQRGGNASNTCTVLSLLGQPCELLACLSLDEHINFMQNDMRKYKIGYSHCPLLEGIACPTATIILSLSTGTRTIVYHNQNLPELTFDNFQQFNLKEYSWIHFEGRNVNQILLMMQHIENYNKSLRDHREKNSCPITVSIELESPRSGAKLLDFLPYADILFISKDFAKTQGFCNMNDVIETIGQNTELRGIIICAWGEEGAMARTTSGAIVKSAAFPPQKVIDTLGAGDTFNAAVLFFLNKKKLQFMQKCKQETTCSNNANRTKNDIFDGNAKRNVKHNFNIESLEYIQTKFIDKTILQNAIEYACYVAGTKVGLRGYDDLDKCSGDI